MAVSIVIIIDVDMTLLTTVTRDMTVKIIQAIIIIMTMIMPVTVSCDL